MINIEKNSQSIHVKIFLKLQQYRGKIKTQEKIELLIMLIPHRTRASQYVINISRVGILKTGVIKLDGSSV
jgi:hypothetical protein